ncbi:MAG: hypothetical protein SFX19_09870 [Alphaproteobacteria bacterium]|nr:hypothetical protein [Alphaproteobacteria bacterium]
MTFILGVMSKHTVWLLADRRLSWENRPPRDDARKVMSIKTSDAVAILGYAGLGETAQGTEPSDWMSRVLRGRNWTLEQSLGAIAGSMQKELPRHLQGLNPEGFSAHHVIALAFVKNIPRLYSIDLELSPDRKKQFFRYTRHECNAPPTAPRPPRIVLAGSGGSYATRFRTLWKREILRLVNAHDEGKISARAVADHLALLNHEVHSIDPFTGPNCIVMWSYRKDGFYKGGGGHEFYIGMKRAQSPFIPSIVNGIDMQALGQEMLAQMRECGHVRPDKINALLAGLPHFPDEGLR